VVFRFYDKSLFEQDLAKCLDKATNNYSVTAGFHVGKTESKAQLRAHLDNYRNREYKETPLLDKFSDIASIVAKASYEGDTFKASLLLIYDVLLRKEQERKGPEYYSTSQGRDGLDVMNFFFDLINHIAGYTEKYYEELAEKVSHEDLVQKYRAEFIKYEDKLSDSPLLGDKHLHCLLVLESCQELLKMRLPGSDSGKDNLARNYLDALILRLIVSADPKYYM